MKKETNMSKKYRVIIAVVATILVVAGIVVGAVLIRHHQEKRASDVFTIRDSSGDILMEDGLTYVKAFEGVDEMTGEPDYCVEIMFDDEAGKQLLAVTQEHIGEDIGIYMGEEELTSVTVGAAIADGYCQITQLPSYEDACEMAEKMSAAVK